MRAASIAQSNFGIHYFVVVVTTIIMPKTSLFSFIVWYVYVRIKHRKYKHDQRHLVVLTYRRVQIDRNDQAVHRNETTVQLHTYTGHRHANSGLRKSLTVNVVILVFST